MDLFNRMDENIIWNQIHTNTINHNLATGALFFLINSLRLRLFGDSFEPC